MITLIQQQFAQNLQTAINIRGISQVECAMRAKIARSNLNRILKCKAVPSLTTCEDLANSLSFELPSLLLSPRDFDFVLKQTALAKPEKKHQEWDLQS